MKLPRRNFLHLAAGAAALPAVSRIARAQAYPSRPITIVVGFVAGGPSDLLGRMVGERFRSSFGQPVVIEPNRRDIAVWRRDDAHDALRSGPEHAGAFSKMVLAQGLGDEDCQAPRDEEGDRGAGTSVGRGHASHMG